MVKTEVKRLERRAKKEALKKFLVFSYHPPGSAGLDLKGFS